MTNLNFLPGQFHLTPGTWKDYRTLARFHYLPKNPATWSEIWAIRYEAPDRPTQLVAVGVVSFPAPTCQLRRTVLGLNGSRRAELEFANRHIRTISRVIVHPQFRALGLSSRLVRCICKHCKTRYVEALAVMGRLHPFFERGGMRKVEQADPDRPVYFIFDRRRRRARSGFVPSPGTPGEG